MAKLPLEERAKIRLGDYSSRATQEMIEREKAKIMKEEMEEKAHPRLALFSDRVAVVPPQKKSHRGGYRGGHRKKTLPDGARIYSIWATDEEREIIKGMVRAIRLRPNDFTKIKKLVSLLENEQNGIDHLISLIH